MAKRVLVVGNINIETTVTLEAFPLPERSSTQAERLGVGVGGVGFNIACALRALGRDVTLASVVGRDRAGRWIEHELETLGISHALEHVARSSQSLVISDASGARHIHTDLAGVTGAVYPPQRFAALLEDCQLVVLSNIAYTRPLLALAQAAAVPVSTDVHALRDLGNPYDHPYFAAAHSLFLSAERLEAPLETVAELRRRYDPQHIVVGLGKGGALVSARGSAPCHIPAFRPPRTLSSVGAGDALHAAFCHFWLAGEAPQAALRLACVFAAHTLTSRESAGGFLSEAQVYAAAQRPNVA